MPESNTPKPAGYPFDNLNADIVLRSSDEVPTDFRVFKLLLSLASPFFATAFTLPQPESNDETPVMEMQEDKHTLQLVLGLCYPISMHEPPRLASLRDLRAVMKTAVKFEMEGIQRHIRTVLLEPRFIETQPLRVYAIACRYSWAEEARAAAWYTLRYTADTPLIEELELISAGTYHRLLRYRKECGHVAASEVAALSVWNPNSSWRWDECRECVVVGRRRKDGEGCPGPRKWWLGWMQSVRDALRERPWGETANQADLFKTSSVKEVKICGECEKDIMAQLGDYIHVLAGKADGYLARRFNMKTVLGTILDPAADKTLMTTLTVTLAMQGLLPVPVAVIILGRDVLLSLSAFYIRYTSLPEPKTFSRYWDFSLPSAEIRPTGISKINTALQLALMGTTTISPILPFDLGVSLIGLQWVVATTTIWSGLSYIFTKDAVRLVSARHQQKPPLV
ncbi:hypothetical protein D9615_007387 [Tricholomella constricta]|uniref:BTB domain-containing protein n=1 Tax=Tricholomella constricta TaxID=117010 RepID=A0A8H5LX69_9AGAR|nr:hypothetical protein D9615_007387 [Tricholomella constricta]